MPETRIIRTSNFNNETINDKLIATVTDYDLAVVMCDALNEKYSTETGDYWYTVVPETYTLHVYNPN